MKRFGIYPTIKKYSFLLVITFATMFSLLYEGYNFGQNDHAIYIPYLQSLVDNSLYHHDVMVQTWKEVYFGSLWKWFAFLSLFFPLQQLFLLFHILIRFFFFLGIYFLMQKLTQKKILSLFAVFLWIFPKPSLGFDIFYNQFGQSEFGLSLLLFALICYFSSHYVIAGLLIAISFYIHPPMAGFLAFCIVCSLFFQKAYKQLLSFIFLVGILAAPIIYPVLLFAKNRMGYDTTWMHLTMIRSPHHSFPFTWSIPTIWFPYLLFTLSSGISLWILCSKNLFPYKKFITILLPMYCFLLAGIIFSEIIPVPKIVAIVPFHISPLVTVLLSLPPILLIYRGLKHKQLVIVTVSCLALLLYFFSNFTFTLNSVQYSFVLLLLGIEGYVLITKKKPQYVLKSFLLVLFCYLCFVKTPQLIRANFLKNDPYLHDWTVTQRWALYHTGKNTLFLTPTYLEGFQVYSKRATFADWKEGTIGYLSPEYLREWWKRMEMIGLTQTHYSYSDQKNIYQHLNEQKVLSIAKQYHIQYLITEHTTMHYSLIKVYENHHFIIYRI